MTLYPTIKAVAAGETASHNQHHPDTVKSLALKGVQVNDISTELQSNSIWIDSAAGDKDSYGADIASVQKILDNHPHSEAVKVAVLNTRDLSMEDSRDLAQALKDASGASTMIVHTPRQGSAVSDQYSRFTLETNHKHLNEAFSGEGLDTFLGALEADHPPVGLANAGLGLVAVIAIAIVARFSVKS